MEQLNLFEALYEKYKIKKHIRLIELFAGIRKNAKSCDDNGITFIVFSLYSILWRALVVVALWVI